MDNIHFYRCSGQEADILCDDRRTKSGEMGTRLAVLNDSARFLL